MLAGIELITLLEAELANLIQKKRDNFDRRKDMDDSSFSERFENSQISQINMKLEILKAGGLSEFDCLLDKDTKEVVSLKIVDALYGPCYIISEQFREKFGTFVGVAKLNSTYTKKGLEKSTVMLPAWVTMENSFGGNSLAAASSLRPMAFPSNRNYFTGEEL